MCMFAYKLDLIQWDIASLLRNHYCQKIISTYYTKWMQHIETLQTCCPNVVRRFCWCFIHLTEKFGQYIYKVQYTETSNFLRRLCTLLGHNSYNEELWLWLMRMKWNFSSPVLQGNTEMLLEGCKICWCIIHLKGAFGWYVAAPIAAVYSHQPINQINTKNAKNKHHKGQENVNNTPY